MRMRMRPTCAYVTVVCGCGGRACEYASGRTCVCVWGGGGAFFVAVVKENDGITCLLTTLSSSFKL